MPRLFIAVNISDAIQHHIFVFQDELREKIKGVTWVKKNALHLTLKFLGEVSEENMAKLSEELAALGEKNSSFAMEIKGTGVFPNWKAVKVFWAGVEQGAQQLRDLSQELEQRLAGLGCAKEQKDFNPHLTLGRIREHQGVPQQKTSILQAYFNQKKDFSFGVQKTAGLTLMQSTLTPEGAVYKQVQSFNLKA